jgi:mRNA interferase MazF
MRKRTIRRGEIWQISFDPTVGSEIRKTRPAVVLSSDDLGLLPVKIVVPLTEYKEYYIDYPWHVRVEAAKGNGLKKTSSADCLQVKSLSTERFQKKLGSLGNEEMDKIINGIALCIEM